MKLHYNFYNADKTETVLLLHGLGSSGADWELQLPALCDRYRILAPDARGHGRSPKPHARYFIQDMATDVVALLDDLHIQSAQVVGLSMGGAMAQQLAISYPDRVESLVLVNTFARIQPAGWGGVFRFFQRIYALQFADMPQLGEPVIARMFPKADQAEIRRIGLERFIAYNTDREVYKSLLRANVQFDVRKQLSAIHCPTLIVAGDRDLTVPMRCKVELRDKIPAAELVIIPDSGHATPIDQSEAFNKVLSEFLARHAVPVP